MNYMKIESASVSNGSGFRVVLWVSGCTLRCAYCQNPETWNFNSGQKFTEEVKEKLFSAIDKEWVSGITFSGGHPLEEPNIKEVLALILEIKEKLPNKNIWLYTGFELTFDNFNDNTILGEVVSKCDYVVDGRYINELRDVTLAFRGSENQRIIDVKKTLKSGNVVLWEDE